MPDAPLISCLCITHDRVPMLRRAVQCFLAQTWGPRELLVLHEDVDHATRDFIAALAHPLVRSLVVPAAPHLALGAKRQLSVEAARGSHVATWDDDDWCAPTRLERQMAVLAASGHPACTLAQWIAYDQPLGQAWLTERHTWEASLLAERAALPRYEAYERGEDFALVNQMVAANQMVLAEGAELYVYRYHGGNVSGRVHFKRNIFAPARRLSAGFSRRVGELLAQGGAPVTHEELLAAL